MTKEFILYEQAVALKKLGFNEPCFATWVGEALDMSLQIPSNDYFTQIYHMNHHLLTKKQNRAFLLN